MTEMKAVFSMLFILALLGSSLEEIRLESHEDHQSEEQHSVAHSHDEHQHTETSADCPHLHTHCSSLCLGVLNVQIYPLPVVVDSTKQAIFSFQPLLSQDFANSLYRPPIA